MKNMKIIVPLLLVLAGGAYKFVLAKPKVEPEPKVHGEVYVLPKEFLVNLDGGRFAKLQVGLILAEPDPAVATPVAAEGEHAAEPPEGFGTNPQEGLVRDLITDALTGAKADELVDPKAREELKTDLAKDITKHSDVAVEHVLFTDITVQ